MTDRQVAPAGPDRRGAAARARRARFVRGSVVGLLLAGALSGLAGCGIRATPAPVYAGEPALRTACPPTGTAVSPPPGFAPSPTPTPAPTWRSQLQEPKVPAAAPSSTAGASATALPSEPPSATPSCLQPSGR